MGILDAPASPFSIHRYKPQLPGGLGWDTGSWPIDATVYELPYALKSIATLVLSPEAAFDAFSTARSAPGATFYIDGASGNDANAGTSQGAAFQHIWKGVQAANAAGVPSKIIVLPTATYYRSFNPWFGPSGTGIYPSVDVAFIASGGRVSTGTFDGFSAPSRDGTFTNCYALAITASTVNRVCDIVNRNRFGNHAELQQVATAAICNATPDSWAHISGTLYINRRDQIAVTTSNTRVFRSGTSCFKVDPTNPVNIYIGGASGADGWDCEGGSSLGVLDANPTIDMVSRKVLVAVNSSFSYAGGAIDTGSRGVSTNSWKGLSYLANCRADANVTDGFNYHDARVINDCYALSINCAARDNGRLQQSSNGHTCHESIKAIDIAGEYSDNHGGTVRNINTSKAWYAGTCIRDDLGDRLYTSLAGAMNPTAVRMDDTAEAWFDRARIVMPAATYVWTTGGSGSKIHRRSCWPVAQPDTGPGTIDAY